MTFPRPRALTTLAVVMAAAGLVAPPALAVTPTTAASAASDNVADASQASARDLLAESDIEAMLTPRVGGPAVVNATTYAGHTTITTPTAQASSADGIPTPAPQALAAPTDIVETPDYCRDPANANPTQPAPGKVPVTVTTLDRNGAPSGGTFTMMDFHCEPYEANGYIAFGVDPAQPRTFYLPPGTYSLLGEVITPDASGRHPDQVTFGGDPEFEVVADEPLDLVVDARDGEPLQLKTPTTSELSIVVLGWARGIEGNPPLMQTSIVYPQASTVTEISVIPSDPVSDGTLEFFPWIRSTSPWASGTLMGRGPALDLDLKLVNGDQVTTTLDSPRPITLRSDLEDVAPGQAVLLTEGPNLAQQIAAASEAGAAAVLVRPAGQGLTQPVVQASIPVLAVTAQQADDIQDRLAAGRGSAHLKLSVDPFSDEVYDLIDSQPAITADPYPGLSRRDLTEVTQTFASDGTTTQMLEARSPSSDPCTCLLTPIFDLVEPGSTRTDYVLDNGSRWQQTVVNDFALQARSAPMVYDEGTPGQVDWFGGDLGAGAKADYAATHAQAPATSAEGRMRLRLGATDGDGHDVSGMFTRSGSITRDGEVVNGAFKGTYIFEAPQEPGDWRVEFSTTHTTALWERSTTVNSAWEFVAGTNPEVTPQALPILEARTSFPVDANSQRVDRGTLTIQPWRADVGSSPATVTVELSHDGGQTWVAVRGHQSQGVWSAKPARGSGSVDVRLTVTDAEGSSLTRTIENAWVD